MKVVGGCAETSLSLYKSHLMCASEMLDLSSIPLPPHNKTIGKSLALGGVSFGG